MPNAPRERSHDDRVLQPRPRLWTQPRLPRILTLHSIIFFTEVRYVGILESLSQFQRLIECRKQVCEELKLDVDDVELSMGMSNDYVHAVS